MTPRVLTVAGSDSSGGAGIQQDLKTFDALGVWGLSAVTSVTAQDSRGVRARHDLSPDVVAAQIEAATSDGGIDAAKTGMLGSAATVEAVARTLGAIPRLVVDPVIAASAGGRLLDDDGIDAVRSLLIPLAAIVTPNADEAGVLTGIDTYDRDSQRAAAGAMLKLGCGAVVITGGHLPGRDVVDLYADADGEAEILGGRVEVADTHGTGCMFSAALAAHLARGTGGLDAARAARAFVERALRARPGGTR